MNDYLKRKNAECQAELWAAVCDYSKEQSQSQRERQCYRDFQGRILYVSPALTNGSTWMTVYQKSNGSLKRVQSKWLPLRETREQAQEDLDRYAEERGLPAVRG